MAQMIFSREEREAKEALENWCSRREWHLFVTSTVNRQVSAQGMATLLTRSLAEWSSEFGMASALWSVESFEKASYHAHMLMSTSWWRIFRACDTRCKSGTRTTSRACTSCVSKSKGCKPTPKVSRRLSQLIGKSASGRMPWWKLSNEYFARTGWTRTFYVGPQTSTDKRRSKNAVTRYVTKYILKKQQGRDELPWGVYDSTGGHFWKD